MKNLSLFTVFFLFLTCLKSFGADPSTESALKALSIQQNSIPAGLTSQDLSKTKSRFSELDSKWEFDLGVSHVVGSKGYFDTSQLGAHLAHYLSNRFFVVGSFAYAFNQLNDSGKTLLNVNGVMPDSSYVKYRTELGIGYNTFYGKMSLSQNSVFYFDQYLVLSPGLVFLNTSTTPALTAEAGLSFWLGQWGVIRLSYVGNLYKDKRVSSEGLGYDSILASRLGFIF